MLKDVWNVNATKCDKVQDAGGTRCDLVYQISESISCLYASSYIKLPRKMCKMLHKLDGKMCRVWQYSLEKVWNNCKISYEKCWINVSYI